MLSARARVSERAFMTGAGGAGRGEGDCKHEYVISTHLVEFWSGENSPGFL